MTNKEIEEYIREIKVSNYVSPKVIIAILTYIKNQLPEQCKDWCCEEKY